MSRELDMGTRMAGDASVRAAMGAMNAIRVSETQVALRRTRVMRLKSNPPEQSATSA